jgi:hypothetical protein
MDITNKIDINKYLQEFKCYSANDTYPELWFKAVSLVFDQFNELVENNGFKLLIQNADSFSSISVDNFRITFPKYGSDKSYHNYHRVYSWIFSQINISNLIEIGLGTNNVDVVSNMGPGGKPGASLRAFRELSPTSTIYGADIDNNILFQEENITTFFVDQLDRETFQNLPDIKYDLIIDDGLHQIGANFNTLLWGLEHLNDGGFIVIEDISPIKPWQTIAYILTRNEEYECQLIKCSNSHLFLINKRKK